ncbi:LOW QUALITY PROTEIN: Krueppel-like factor 17 [Peromyscus eremicus]|uniref:LOW QUALITY PROTEIN: Krueppel-like factor 17 n=1 Tax=Peromyscus eremicus TaxID=42410 RepID=UPI0027DB18F8|nr:LOW QUALITY PROTEIN: Krueppel-like factor 17 [Peromyscus eremicus]
MEQENRWPAMHQSPMDNEQSTPTLHVSVSPGSSGVHQPQATQHLSRMSRLFMFSAEESRQNEGEGESQFIMSLPEHSGSTSQLTPPPSQMYHQTPSNHQPGRMIDSRSHMMPLGSPGTLGVTIAFRENLLPHSSLPGSASSVPVMAHSSAATMPYSVSSVVPATTGSLNCGILLVPGMPSTVTHAMSPSMDQMLHLNPYHPGIPPPGLQPLPALESQDSFETQSNRLEEPFIREKPTPAPQATENSSVPGGAPRKPPPVSRPYLCSYNNCGKAYTKHSHLMSHQHKHTGEKPYIFDWEGCIWSFFHSDELRRRGWIHTRYRPHKYKDCGQQFMRSYHLKQHQKTLHTHQRVPDFLTPKTNSGPTDGQIGGPLAPSQRL